MQNGRKILYVREEPTASSGVNVGTRSVSDYTLPKDRGQSTSDDNRSSEYMRMNVYLTLSAGHGPATTPRHRRVSPFRGPRTLRRIAR